MFLFVHNYIALDYRNSCFGSQLSAN